MTLIMITFYRDGAGCNSVLRVASSGFGEKIRLLFRRIFNGSMIRWPNHKFLFPHAKSFENELEHIIGVGYAGDEVEGPQRVVKVE
jgi:hypothetical protein